MSHKRKSSFLSEAGDKVYAYPYNTLVPNVGKVVDLKDKPILKEPTDLAFQQDLRLLDKRYINSKQSALNSNLPSKKFVPALNDQIKD